MRTIVFNRDNILADGQNNKLIYNFPNSVRFKDSYIAVSQVNMYYSWVNISALIGNNVFSYIFWDGAAGVTNVYTTFTITIPDGLYQVAEINFLLQKEMIDNGTYLINTDSNNVYPIELVINPTRYAVQINTYSFPNPELADQTPASLILPVGWSYPANWVSVVPQGGLFPPNVTFNAIISIPENFSKVVGYTTPIPFVTDPNESNTAAAPITTLGGQKNAVTGGISYLSNTAPDVNPNSSIYLNLSNIDNAYAQPTGIIYAITPNVIIGGTIAEKPPQFAWNKLIEGTYNQLRLDFLGVDLKPVQILDPNMTIMMVIKDRNEL